MREIAAASDFDFVASEPAPAPRKSRAPGARARDKSARTPQFLTRLWSWRTPLFGGLAFVLLLAAIAVNAMFLQHGRHPAPLMGSVLRIETPKVEPAPAPVAKAEAKAAPSALDEALAPMPLAKVAAPAKIVAPGKIPTPAKIAAPAKTPAPVKAVKALPAPPSAAPVKAAAKPSDAIGALMVNAAPAVPAKNIADAQKALNKLGAHVPANGKIDAATRKAVEKFQRDNGLPVTGELTPKLRHFLALQAGEPEG
ncbi:hypothetical protein CCR94_13145 [Rhodoblastus sphagnicola]|uniref:Peptidoglycan binding-like domain-containing protein n=1 Tax=Rhodoblastus sphagnicola TaxID=333368 RepID=A0A2S6N6M7_9HYPH|nr:peptidoglycan-binding domain-containing protein [Rhodoblastus sphagnicola]MBB4197630.1 hypothetical protein [Rhodoblastus sphagnicola]PPQ30262.1 hypothetical protein CCR94_13145 [Rhodoblastus sphagnicola]